MTRLGDFAPASEALERAFLGKIDCTRRLEGCQGAIDPRGKPRGICPNCLGKAAKDEHLGRQRPRRSA